MLLPIVFTPEQHALAHEAGSAIYEARRGERYSERREGAADPSHANYRGLLAEIAFEIWTEGKCPANLKVFTDRNRDACDFRAGPLLGDVKSNPPGNALVVRQGTVRHDLYVLVALHRDSHSAEVVGWTDGDRVRKARLLQYHRHYHDLQHVLAPNELWPMEQFKELYWDVLGGCK